MKRLSHILALAAASLMLGTSCNTKTPTTDNVAEDTTPIIACDTIRLLFGGDFMQHMPQVVAARKA